MFAIVKGLTVLTATIGEGFGQQQNLLNSQADIYGNIVVAVQVLTEQYCNVQFLSQLTAKVKN